MSTELLVLNTEESGIGRVTAVARLADKREVLRHRILNCFALVWVTHGHGWLRQGEGKRTKIQQGDAFVLYPDVPHGYGPGGEGTWTEWYVMFEGAVFNLWREQGILSPQNRPFHLVPEEIWERRIRRIREGATALEQVCALQSFLSLATAGGTAAAPEKEDGDWLSRACVLLDDLRLEEEAEATAARELGVSYQTFRKRFRSLMGMPPGAYRRSRVLDLAARRLLTESVPIKELASDLGFCDEYHFSHRFRAQHGMSPGAYRKRLL